MLPRRPLGKSGIAVSSLGLGTVKFGRNTGVKYPQRFSIPDDHAASELLNLAKQLGINLLDTAPAYGNAEERLGDLLTGQRDNWVICTKAGEEFDPQNASSTFDFSRDGVRRSVERSLSRLRTDKLDCVLLHSDGRDRWILEESGGLEALREMQSQSLVRAVGISTKSPEGALLAVSMCDVIMVTLNQQERADLPAINEAHTRGVGVLVKKALMSGAAGAQGAAEAIGFALAPEGVSSVIVGTINPANLQKNVEAARSPRSRA